MKQYRLGVLVLALVFVIAGISGSAFGQAGGQGNNNRGNRGNRGNNQTNIDPAQMRQGMMDRLKTQLGSPDEEWTVLAPKLEKLMTVQRDARGSGRTTGGRGGRGGQTAAAPDQAQSELAKATEALRKAIEDKTTSSADLGAKVTAYRAARDKGRADLAAAQKDVKELLTARQEALLVTMGMLQ